MNRFNGQKTISKLPFQSRNQVNFCIDLDKKSNQSNEPLIKRSIQIELSLLV